MVIVSVMCIVYLNPVNICANYANGVNFFWEGNIIKEKVKRQRWTNVGYIFLLFQRYNINKRWEKQNDKILMIQS